MSFTSYEHAAYLIINNQTIHPSAAAEQHQSSYIQKGRNNTE